ncbi:MAG: hypothetical protein FWH01_11510 [Oscillospiraceae bacterium]|nr:hypothetical protein [Oscillospiraceae bacterium]
MTSSVTAAGAQHGVFDGLLGQQAAKDKLTGLLYSGAQGGAHLFLGAAGIGKRVFARAFAKAVLCAGGAAGGTVSVLDAVAHIADAVDAVSAVAAAPGRLPCGVCLPCRLFQNGALGDFLFIAPSGQSQRPAIPVDAARSVVDWFSTRPLHSSKKVCIIAQADHMTEQAQNALLKTLEEPPAYGAIILTAENPGMLLDTVRSRCSTTFFTGYTDREVEYILRNADAPPHESAIPLLTRLSGGNPGYAFGLAQSETFMSTRDELFGLFCGHLDGDPRATYMLQSFLEKNRERFAHFAGMVIFLLRDIWLLSMGGMGIRSGDDVGASGGASSGGGSDSGASGANSGDSGVGAEIVNADMERRLAAYGERFRPGALLDCIERVDETCSQVSKNANFNLAVNAMLVKISATLNTAYNRSV